MQKHFMDRINDFLDRHILPWPVRFLTFRFVILATIALLIPLILFADNTVMVLGLNSYLNTMSVAVSSIVLLYATLTEARQKQIAEMQEQRAQEDHTHVTEMHNLLMQSIANQHEEIQELKEFVSSLHGKSYTRKKIEPVKNLRLLHSRGTERFGANHVETRIQTGLHHNELTRAIRQDLKKGTPTV